MKPRSKHTPNNFNFCFLFETCNIVPNSQIQILESTKTPSGVPKIAFKAVMQTLEERNKNGRLYTNEIGKEIVEVFKPQAQSRCLFQEVDHPCRSGNGDADKQRAVTVEMKNCGSLIRNIGIEGNKIIAEIETLSGFLGPDMYNVIVYDKADIGYSLRMFGRVEMEGATGIARVSKPIRPITYDTVTNPSHATAKRIEFLSENISSFLTKNERHNLQILNESAVIEDKLQFQNVNESVYDYADQLVQHFMSHIGPVHFKF